MRRKVSQALGERAYDSAKVYQELEARRVELVIRLWRNSRLDTPSPFRRGAVRRYMDLGHDAWARLKDYNRRRMAETAFSTFKRLSESTASLGAWKTLHGIYLPRLPYTTSSSTCEPGDYKCGKLRWWQKAKPSPN